MPTTQQRACLRFRDRTRQVEDYSRHHSRPLANARDYGGTQSGPLTLKFVHDADGGHDDASPTHDWVQ